MEEELTKANAQKRKMQRDNEELAEQVETSNRELSSLRTRGKRHLLPLNSLLSLLSPIPSQNSPLLYSVFLDFDSSC